MRIADQPQVGIYIREVFDSDEALANQSYGFRRPPLLPIGGEA